MSTRQRLNHSYQFARVSDKDEQREIMKRISVMAEAAKNLQEKKDHR